MTEPTHAERKGDAPDQRIAQLSASLNALSEDERLTLKHALREVGRDDAMYVAAGIAFMTVCAHEAGELAEFCQLAGLPA